MMGISNPAIIAIISALAMIFTALVTQVGMFRTSTRSTRSQRESAIDSRIDAQLAALAVRYEALGEDYDRLIEARDKALYDRDDYRERLVTLRLAMRQRGLDPDKVPSEGDPWPSTASSDGTTGAPTTPS
jgi:hypothetical protein